MQYLGGKTRIAGELVDVMIRESGVDPAKTTAVDLCCGAGSVSAAFARAGFRRVVAYDAQPRLVTMWQALLASTWEPPERVTEERWVRGASNVCSASSADQPVEDQQRVRAPVPHFETAFVPLALAAQERF